MSNGIKYFLVFVEGMNSKGEIEKFPVTYSGKRIIWEYLIDTVEEDFNLLNVKFNGYEEVSEQKYREMSVECKK